MTQLKTLKELEILHKGRDTGTSKSDLLYNHLLLGEYITICYPEQLKQETIKWIKELEKDYQLNFYMNYSQNKSS